MHLGANYNVLSKLRNGFATLPLGDDIQWASLPHGLPSGKQQQIATGLPDESSPKGIVLLPGNLGSGGDGINDDDKANRRYAVEIRSCR